MSSGAPSMDTGDPPGEAPWAMQLVVRVERHQPPTESAVCATAGRAVVALLTDERCRSGGPWAAEVERWRRGRIRKVVRRARAHAWERACELDGLTMVGEPDPGTGVVPEVRAFVPGPTDAVPLEVARLQIRGLDLEDPHRRPAADPGPLEPGVVVALAPLDLFSTGKKAAAAGHAAQLAAEAMSPHRRRRWSEAGWPMVCIQPDPEGWHRLRMAAPVVVADAGFTEVEPGTVTAVALWA